MCVHVTNRDESQTILVRLFIYVNRVVVFFLLHCITNKIPRWIEVTIKHRRKDRMSARTKVNKMNVMSWLYKCTNECSSMKSNNLVSQIIRGSMQTQPMRLIHITFFHINFDRAHKTPKRNRIRWIFTESYVKKTCFRAMLTAKCGLIQMIV